MKKTTCSIARGKGPIQIFPRLKKLQVKPKAHKKLKDEIPALYGQLLPQAFLEQDATEPLATCHNCRMCQSQFANPPFLSTTKCCTFYPFVANFLAGGILQSGGEGAKRLKELILKRQWALPIGLVPPPSYQQKFNLKRPDEFGRNYDFLCPFHEKGGCSIWQYRNSECSTYFCAYQEGEKGKTRWIGISETLFQAEMKISQECMLQKGYSWSEVKENLEYLKIAPERPLQAYEAPYEMDALTYQKFWQHHSDDPVQYFIDCFKWAQGLKTLP